MGNQRSRERVTKPCDNCGKPVTRLKSADAPRFYCNHACYSSSEHRAQRTSEINAVEHVTKPCSQCSAPVTRPPSQMLKDTRFCSRDCHYAYRWAQAKRTVTAGGYVMIGVPGDYPGARPNGKSGQILEHRKVMQDMLGRVLLPEENVHHINGVKDDNRPENLELWTSSQPSGQRVADKIKWAREIIARYEGLETEEKARG